MKRSAFIVLIAVLGFYACKNSPERKDDNVKVTKNTRDSSDIIKNGDHAFLSNAARGSIAEMELGKLAVSNSSNERVKKFGMMLAADHKTLREQLKAMALSKSILLPQNSGEGYNREISRLKNRQGPAFDLPFMKLMVKEHRSDVKRFRTAVNDASDADIQSFARETLPVLQKHLDSAKVIYNSLKPPIDNVIVP